MSIFHLQQNKLLAGGELIRSLQLCFKFLLEVEGGLLEMKLLSFLLSQRPGYVSMKQPLTALI